MRSDGGHQAPGSGWFERGAMVAGARDILPLSAAAFAFGLAYGVAVAQSPFADLAGVLSSFIVLAGAAQLAIVDLADQGAPWFVVVGTALVINARLTMYSGALAPAFSAFPTRWRLALAHFLTDQTTITALLHFEEEPDPRRRMAYFAGAAGSFALTWIAATLIGVAIGAAVPPELQIGFAVPLMFVALAVPAIRDRATLVAAAVGFSVTLLARDAPLNTGLLIGAGAGITFGLLVRFRWDDSPSVAAPSPSSSDAAS
jgi:predicted branched-subunit amino acid permease